MILCSKFLLSRRLCSTITLHVWRKQAILDLSHSSILHLPTASRLAHDDLVHSQNGEGGIDCQTEGIGLGVKQISNGGGISLDLHVVQAT